LSEIGSEQNRVVAASRSRQGKLNEINLRFLAQQGERGSMNGQREMIVHAKGRRLYWERYDTPASS
jgi:hypothetical protein